MIFQAHHLHIATPWCLGAALRRCPEAAGVSHPDEAKLLWSLPGSAGAACCGSQCAGETLEPKGGALGCMERHPRWLRSAVFGFFFGNPWDVQCFSPNCSLLLGFFVTCDGFPRISQVVLFDVSELIGVLFSPVDCDCVKRTKNMFIKICFIPQLFFSSQCLFPLTIQYHFQWVEGNICWLHPCIWG